VVTAAQTGMDALAVLWVGACAVAVPPMAAAA
jgi:hypothetical protein